MAIPDGEMKTPAMVKWPKILWGTEREQKCGERESEDVMRKKSKLAF